MTAWRYASLLLVSSSFVTLTFEGVIDIDFVLDLILGVPVTKIIWVRVPQALRRIIRLSVCLSRFWGLNLD